MNPSRPVPIYGLIHGHVAKYLVANLCHGYYTTIRGNPDTTFLDFVLAPSVWNISCIAVAD